MEATFFYTSCCLLLFSAFPNLETIGIVYLWIIVNHLKVDEIPFFEVDVGEESVGLEFFIEAGQVEAVGLGKELFVDAATAHDEDFILVSGHFQSLWDGSGKFIAFGSFVQAVGNHNVAAVGQSLLSRQREPSVVPHDDAMATSDLLEMFQVVAVVPDELVVDADGAIGSHGYDDGYCHISCQLFSYVVLAGSRHCGLDPQSPDGWSDSHTETSPLMAGHGS